MGENGGEGIWAKTEERGGLHRATIERPTPGKRHAKRCHNMQRQVLEGETSPEEVKNVILRGCCKERVCLIRYTKCEEKWGSPNPTGEKPQGA